MDRFDYLIRALTRIDGLTGEAYEKRYRGLDWPADGAETMIGVERMTNVKDLTLDVIKRGVPGDFMECGIWRGGVGILLASILQYFFRDPARRPWLWLADSFEGCPSPSHEFPADAGDRHSTFKFLGVPLEEVRGNFARYGLADSTTTFLPGWFKNTLPGPVEQLALLRLDGDMYESTMQCLDALYDRVSPGGYIICDDYQNIPNCRAAIQDFWFKRAMSVNPIKVDRCAVYWQKEATERKAAA